ncbi:uncharacterized protein LOC131632457 [Vicia villosa]|uniref:uncharacterized protein LOC131632457 n=1 Tax=Vicia villosa TaxID=3911 RepID=UPI00273C832E|nr:uncharacterized protein LOC131632457 [Vicia villosa]
MMLTVAKRPTCYEDIKKVGGIVRESFRDACFEIGFLNDDKEYVAAINEAKDWGSGHFLRKLFVTMLLSGTINRPRHVWEKTWKTLSDGILHRQRQDNNRRDMQLTDAELKNLALIKIENMLQSNRRSLHEFKDIPYPDSYVTRHVGNRLIYDERDYNADTERENFNNLFRALTGGRTAHSKLKLPVPTLNNSTCNVDKNTEHSQLFEWKVVVFGGDFRQILLVVPRVGRSDIVHASICSSYIWDYCQVLTLTKNIRLQQGRDGTCSKEITEFSKWILNVGDGKISEPNDGLVDIEIPPELLIPILRILSKLLLKAHIPIWFMYSKMLHIYKIFASTIEVVDKINHYVLDLIPGEEKEYLS